LARLCQALQPEGALEQLLVEKLATTAWRQRRLLLAEGAEIQKNREFVEWDQRNREHEAAGNFLRLLDPLNNEGLIRKPDNPDVLERCLDLLSELQAQIKKKGFNVEYDKVILEKVYGDRDDNRLREDLYGSYVVWQNTSETSEEERVRENYASPEQSQQNIIQEIEKEIRRLKRYQKERASIETARTRLEVLSRSVPDATGLDRLLRYDASLERAFDRTLSQLERLQRMRLGRPVPPRIEVKV